MLMCCLPVSCAVHGLCGGAAVNESTGLQHQDSGHQVKINMSHLLSSLCFKSALV